MDGSFVGLVADSVGLTSWKTLYRMEHLIKYIVWDRTYIFIDGIIFSYAHDILCDNQPKNQIFIYIMFIKQCEFQSTLLLITHDNPRIPQGAYLSSTPQ